MIFIKNKNEPIFSSLGEYLEAGFRFLFPETSVSETGCTSDLDLLRTTAAFLPLVVRLRARFMLETADLTRVRGVVGLGEVAARLGL